MSEATMEEPLPFRFPEVTDKSNNIIKVVGVGGGGGNAVRHMYEEGVKNASFVVCNTDSQALVRTEVPDRLQLGEEGLGVGGNPELGKAAAESSIENIKRMMDDTTQMVFITAGMGGGTGTGAAPVIARVAKELGILTIGVVTLPFAFEKKKRIDQALLGVEEMKKNVDSLLVINNQRLVDLYADGITTIRDAFSKVDDVLATAVKTIAEIITQEGVVNRDFCDVKTVMQDGGEAIVTVGRASGENRIFKAMQNALQSPLLNSVRKERAQRLLYVIYTCNQQPVRIEELCDVNLFMDELDDNLEVLWGLYEDDSLGDDVKVAIIATGFDKDKIDERIESPDSSTFTLEKLWEIYYGGRMKTKGLEQKVESDERADDSKEEEKNEDAPNISESVPKKNLMSEWSKMLLNFLKEE